MLKILLFFIFVKLCFCGCPNGTIASFSNPNNCYLFVLNQSAFITAEGFCRQQGGHLTSISNAFDNMFLSQEAASYFHESVEANFWIGATNELTQGQWSWMDGTPFEYKDWMKGQPENVTTSNCASSSITTSLWTAEDCFKNKSYVCLIPAPLDTTTTTTTTIASTTHKPYKCEDGWTLFKPTGFCYKAFSNMNMTWQDSEHFCLNNYSAHLASIHSEEENGFIADLARQAIPTTRDDCGYYQCWIGLFTVTDNQLWLWSDNTFIDYLGWSPGEPNNPGEENCVQLMLHSNCLTIYGEKINFWSNKICSLIEQNFVCKKPHLTDF